MKAICDERTDALSIILKPDVPVAESDEDKPGVILDDVIADASRRKVPLLKSRGSSGCRWEGLMRLCSSSSGLPTDSRLEGFVDNNLSHYLARVLNALLEPDGDQSFT